MSSVTERRSPQDFIAKEQQLITAAEKVYPCVAVTEANWKAMITTQKDQIELLQDILDTLSTLTTEEKLKEYMDEKLKTLTEAAESFQTAMDTSKKELTESINQTIEDTKKQVGNTSESFSQNLSILRSRAEEKLEKHLNRLFWMSMIPSAVLIVLELIRHILSAISVI